MKISRLQALKYAKHWLNTLLLSCLLFSAGLFSAKQLQAVDLPDIGTSADQIFSPQEEQELGEAFIRQLRQQVTMVDDSEVVNYLNALGTRLTSFTDNPVQRFTFFMLADDDINAFAVPGGYVGVNSGLILHTRDESELASVLAHEISHVTQRHIARTVESTGKYTIASAAILLASILIGSRHPEVAQAGMATVAAGNAQMDINFTMSHEKEADRVGMQLLAKAGFNPMSMPDFFAELQNASRLDEGSLPEFLRTHPVTTDRIAEARDRAEHLPKTNATGASGIASTSLDYHLMRAKVLVLTNNQYPALQKRLQESLTSGYYREIHAVHYALALLGLQLNQPDQVQEHLAWLQKNDADRVTYRLLKIRLALLQKDLPQAAQACQQALELYPGDRQLTQEYANILLEQGQSKKAQELLAALVPPYPPDYYRQLASAQKANGKAAEAFLSLAEFYYAEGKTARALEQLEMAQRLPNLDFYVNSRLEARKATLESELKDEKEARGEKTKGKK